MFNMIRNSALGVVAAVLIIVGVNVYGDTLITVGTSDAIGPVGNSDEAKGPKKVATFGELMQNATIKAGQKVAKKCLSCHTFKEGGSHKVGPNLANTVGAQQAKKSGFTYSKALLKLGGTWSYEELDSYLTKPAAYAPGTKMTFAGLKKAKDRAAIITYLASVTQNPPPLPTP